MYTDLEILQRRVALALAEYWKWSESGRRDGGSGVLERFNREGWIWDNDLLCWRKQLAEGKS